MPRVRLAILLLAAFVAAATAAGGRWHPDSPEERWAVILAKGQRLPQQRMAAGLWRIAGHAHRRLNATHLILARPRSAPLSKESDPSTWPGVVAAHKLVPQRRKHRGVVEDATNEPLWNKQWHLHEFNFPASFTPPTPAHISAVEAWLSGALGEGSYVAVVDDGLQFIHPDIKTNYNAQGSYDFNYDKPDVTPSNYDAHGTEAAGTAAAGVNAACGSGVAPLARVAGIRLLATDSVTDEQEALSLSYEDQLNQIYSNSWGPYDDGQRLEGPGPLTRAAMKEAVTTGRNGRGVIYVWAAGNGRAVNDNCNFDGYANNRYTITVPAVTSLGKGAPYSEDCSANVVCAPSNSNYENPYKIVTTDLMGSAGVSPTDCSMTFGGTSAAAPIVAGVVALMLSARPELGWRDVQGVLIHSADAIDESSLTWQTNGAGLRYSHTYGFGRVNASRAVELSRTWTNYPEDVEIASPSNAFAANATSNTITFTSNIRVESVAVVVTARVSRRGRLALMLTSPSGTVSYIAPFHPDSQANISAWSFGSVAHWDEASAGAWTLSWTADGAAGTPSSISWELHIYGHIDLSLASVEI